MELSCDLGAAHEEDKLEFLTELSSFCSRNREPIMIGGDFNIIRYNNERNKLGGHHMHSDTFNSLVHFYELREIYMSGGLYTWSNNQDNPTLEKPDRILVSKDWEDIFPKILVKKLPREVSDYNPLIIYNAVQKPTVHIQFKFELSWLDHPDFIPMVKKYGINHVGQDLRWTKFSRS